MRGEVVPFAKLSSPDICREVSACSVGMRKDISWESLLSCTMDWSIAMKRGMGPSTSVMVGCSSSADAISVRGSSPGGMSASSLSLSVAIGSE